MIDTASDCFYRGKDLCREDNVLNVRIVKQESLRSFGNSSLWSATQVFCSEFVETEGEFNMVSINAKMMIEEKNIDRFVQHAIKYDVSLAGVAREVAVAARKCAQLGIDFIEVR